SLGVRTLTEFVDLAKAKPGTINYGSAGIGTATHLAGMYFASQTGTNLVHVPYTVSSTIIADLLGGRIHVTFAPAAFTLPLLQDGRLLALAVAANEPTREPIAVPTALSAHIDYQNATCAAATSTRTACFGGRAQTARSSASTGASARVRSTGLARPAT